LAFKNARGLRFRAFLATLCKGIIDGLHFFKIDFFSLNKSAATTEKTEEEEDDDYDPNNRKATAEKFRVNISHRIHLP
jgi:hypothetical protein